MLIFLVFFKQLFSSSFFLGNVENMNCSQRPLQKKMLLSFGPKINGIVSGRLSALQMVRTVESTETPQNRVCF